MTVCLAVEDLLILCDELGQLSVRDLGLLDSAAHRPSSSLLGADAYPHVLTKAAVLLESIVRNHPFVDGNQRLGWVAAVVLLGMNGVTLDAPEDPAYELVIGVAAGHLPYQEVAEALSGWVARAE